MSISDRVGIPGVAAVWRAPPRCVSRGFVSYIDKFLSAFWFIGGDVGYFVSVVYKHESVKNV